MTKTIDSTVASPAGETIQKRSMIGGLWHAVVRFWDSGTASVDALYSHKNDSRSYVEFDGVSPQYHGSGKAIPGRMTGQSPNQSTADDRLGQILEAQAQFRTTIPSALAVHGNRRKAS